MSENPYSTPAPLTDVQPSPPGLLKTLLKIVVFAGIAILLIGLFLPNMIRSREPARRTQCKNNLKMIALALHCYHDVYAALPPAYTVDANGQRLHSWRTLILPWLEHSDRYGKIDLTKPWDHPVNAAVFEETPDSFCCPGSDLPQDFTTYLAIVGENACFHATKPRAISEITDGTLNTLMVIEVPVNQAVHWMSPYDADEQMVLSIGSADKVAHTGGVQAAMADGSTRFLGATVDPETRRAVISINGKEVVGEF